MGSVWNEECDAAVKKLNDVLLEDIRVGVTELKAFLQKTADKTAWLDDKEFMVDDYAGGNIDDAYSGGVSDGEILMAREILGWLE